jgi:hypothetical protein
MAIGDPGVTTDIRDKEPILVETMGDFDSEAMHAQNTAKQQEAVQKEIDRYNDEILKGIYDPSLDQLRFINQNVVVRLLKCDYLKPSSELNVDDVDKLITERLKVRQKVLVDDTTRTNGARGLWVDNPLPYRFAGVICAVDPLVLEAVNDKDVKVWDMLTPGTFVQTVQFDVKSQRYYPQDQMFDPINEADPENMPTFPEFEGYCVLTPGMIRAIVSNPEYLRTGPTFDDITK